MTLLKEALTHPIFKTVGEVADTLGLECYVVGGYVRDFLLQRDLPSDIDFVTVGSGIALAKAVSEKLDQSSKVTVFKTYGTAMLQHQGLDLEFVGARKESYRKESRNPIVEDGTLTDDQNRRDFTINAMAICINSSRFGELIDPFGGCIDLENGILKTPTDPDITFSDDPLRMMRAIRFAAQLNFNIDTPTLESIKRQHPRIEIITKERIVTELNKILLSPIPSVGLGLLKDSGLLDHIIPELTALEGIEEIEGKKHKDNFWHTLEVVDNMARLSDDLWLRWAALLHDIGKAPTKRFDQRIGWTFHGHEFVGSKMVYRLFKRLKMPLNDAMKRVQKLVLMSSRPIVISEDFVTDSAVRRLIFDAGEELEGLMTLCISDITTKNPRKQDRYKRNFEVVKQKIQEVEQRDHIRNFQPPISGELIMTTFGIGPCKEVGKLKELVKEAILEGEIPNEFEPAYELMLKHATQMGLQAIIR
jgi:tRNA nucleotidyltransferase (CCA-adding enzyme)